MNSQKIVFKETGIVLLGQVICVPVMYGIFALLGYFDSTVLLGGIVGAVLATANFFFMAISTSLAADKAEKQDVKGGQALIQLSYLLRQILLFVLLIVCAKSGRMHLIALVLPLVFVRLIITIAEFIRKKGDNQA